MSQDPGRQPAVRAPEPGAGAVEPVASRTRVGSTGDYRDQLRSRRWDAAPLRNPEVERTDPRIAVAAILLLCVLTLIVLVVGYGSGFWSLPT
jgi:hypothetical protein